MKKTALTLAVLGALAGACSSSSSAGGASGGSLPGTWCPPESASPNDAASFTFSSGGQCQYSIGQDDCNPNATCTGRGNTLTIDSPPYTPPCDAGMQVCTYTLIFTNGGSTLEIKSNGGQTGCPSLDATGLTQSGCSFGCGSSTHC